MAFFKSFAACNILLLSLASAVYAQDAGSPSAGGSVTADLGNPMSVEQRIKFQTKRLESLQVSGSSLKMGDMEDMKKTYVKIRRTGVDISPEDFLAYRMALDKLSLSKATPLFAGINPGEASAAKLNEASAVTLIIDKSPTAGLMDAFKLDKKKAEMEWKQAKQTMKQTAKNAKSK